VEEEPEIYEKEELDTLFRAWFEFFLMTGMREQEVMYCYWSDVNLTARTVRVTHKPDRGVDAEGVQGTRDPHLCEARKESQGM